MADASSFFLRDLIPGGIKDRQLEQECEEWIDKYLRYDKNIPNTIVEEFKKRLQMPFEQGEIGENQSPVCYAHSSEVRSDYAAETFPVCFGRKDIWDYALGCVEGKFRPDQPIPFPADGRSFWRKVDAGRNFREK